MKTLFKWLPWVLVVVLAAGYFFRSPESADTQSNDNEIKAIHSTRDSLTQVIEAKTDTIQALRGRAESAEFQAMKARKENRKLIQEKNEIPFILSASDSAQFIEVAKLYGSLRHGSKDSGGK